MNKSFRTALCIILGFMCLGLNAYAENYISRLASELQVDVSELPDDIRQLNEQATKAATHDRDPSAAREIFSALSRYPPEKLAPDTLTYFMAKFAVFQEVTNQYSEAVITMDKIRELRQEPEADEIRFLVDLEIARAMAQSGGHPNIKGFDPTIEDMEKAFNRIFTTYSAYRWEVLDAHLWYAEEARFAAQGPPGKEHYMADALEHIEHVNAITRKIHADPKLAHDEATRMRAEVLLVRTDEELPRWRAVLARMPRPASQD